MKLHDFVGAPNPKKVRVYLAEKGITIPVQPVNIVTGENRTPEFLKRNPLGGLPVLELDDGTFLPESLAIIEYFEELHPDPPMIGTTPLDRARVRALERVAELGVLNSIATIFQNSHPFMAGRLKQSADTAENARARLGVNLKALDDAIGKRPFVAGTRPTIADCTLLAALGFGEFAGVPLDPAFKNVGRWYDAFRARERERFERLFPRHRTVVLERAGHYIQEDAPEDFIAAIEAWDDEDRAPVAPAGRPDVGAPGGGHA